MEIMWEMKLEVSESGSGETHGHTEDGELYPATMETPVRICLYRVKGRGM